MINLLFSNFNAVRRVSITGKKITMITPENGYNPIAINLEEINNKLGNISNNPNINKDDLAKLSMLNTEPEMAQSIIEDFKQSGWRLISRDGRGAG